MPLPPIWSRRKRAAQPPSDVYKYDDLPGRLRVQICQIWQETFGEPGYGNDWPTQVYKKIVKLVRKEKGVFQLAQCDDDFERELLEWFLRETDVDLLIDALEFSCIIINGFVRGNARHFEGDPDSALAEINARLLEAAVGYQFQDNRIVRVDNLLLHKEVVVPALTLLTDPAFAGAEAEFREAHKQFRAGDYERCLTECCKALESVLKTIGAKRGWAIAPTDPLKKLLDSAFANSLIPLYLQAEFTGLRTVLESGVGTVRNKSSGHGAGATPRVIPAHLAAFQMHQTAAAIVLLVDAHNATP